MGYEEQLQKAFNWEEINGKTAVNNSLAFRLRNDLETAFHAAATGKKSTIILGYINHPDNPNPIVATAIQPSPDGVRLGEVRGSVSGFLQVKTGETLDGLMHLTSIAVPRVSKHGLVFERAFPVQGAPAQVVMEEVVVRSGNDRASVVKVTVEPAFNPLKALTYHLRRLPTDKRLIDS